MHMRAILIGTLFFLLAASSGCGGGGGVAVDGKVVNGSAAYNPATDGDLSINLSGDQGGGHTGSVKADGTFTIKDSKGGNVPTGKYKVGVTRYPVMGGDAKAKGPPMPTTKDTGETWDVSSSNHSFTLDMSKVK